MENDVEDRITWAFGVLVARGYVDIDGGAVYSAEAWRQAIAIISEAWNSGMINIQNPVI